MAGGSSVEKHDARPGGPSGRILLVAWLCLLAGTALTVTAAGLDLGRLAIAVVLAIAAAKSTLVLLYFMHLRWERRLLVRLLVPITLAVLAIFIGLTYTDILNR